MGNVPMSIIAHKVTGMDSKNVPAILDKEKIILPPNNWADGGG